MAHRVSWVRKLVAWLSRPARMCVRNPCRPLLPLGLTAVRKHPEPTAVDCQNSADCRPMVTAGRKRKRPLRWNECSGLRGADGNRAKSCKINIYNTSFERVYLTVYFCLKVIPEKIARSTDHNNISSALITALVSFKVGFHKF